MPGFTCTYCGTSFKSNYLLARHQRRAQYCLQIQGKEIKRYTCECGKSYTLKSNLQRHTKVCNVIPNQVENEQQPQPNDLIKMFGEMMSNMQKTNYDMVQKLISEVSNAKDMTADQRNVVLQSLEALTNEKLIEHIEHLSINFIQDGARGYASFAGEYPLKDRVVCTDKARRKLRYKNEDGELSDNGRLLARRFFIAIAERNKEILNKAYSDLQQELQQIVLEGRAGESDVTGILSKATKFQDILIRSQNVAEGKDEEFAQDFLNHLSKIL